MKAAIVGLLLAASITFGQKITIEADDSADFTRYKTFRLVIDSQNKAKGAVLNNELVTKKIQEEIRKRLLEKGLQEASEKPDLNVRFTFTTPRRNEVDAYPAGRYGRATRRVKTAYTDGTLTIDLRDTGQRSLVWK